MFLVELLVKKFRFYIFLFCFINLLNSYYKRMKVKEIVVNDNIVIIIDDMMI